MSRKHLQLEPHRQGEHVWWYEENGGIWIAIQPVVNGIAQPPVSCSISWRSLRAALARKDRKP